eukprot:3419502-Prymnesium_polylepis.1
MNTSRRSETRSPRAWRRHTRAPCTRPRLEVLDQRPARRQPDRRVLDPRGSGSGAAGGGPAVERTTAAGLERRGAKVHQSSSFQRMSPPQHCCMRGKPVCT